MWSFVVSNDKKWFSLLSYTAGSNNNKKVWVSLLAVIIGSNNNKKCGLLYNTVMPVTTTTKVWVSILSVIGGSTDNTNAVSSSFRTVIAGSDSNKK